MFPPAWRFHRYYNIPGWFMFQDVYDRAVALFPDGSHFVEVGSWKGRSSSYMAVAIAQSGKDIRLTCVDTWLGSKDHLSSGISCAGLFEQFQANMAGLKYNPVRLPSVQAAARYEDVSLDFVFLDASHEAEDVRDDVLAWRPKLNPSGGVLAGDDYKWPSVKRGLVMAGVRKVVEGSSGTSWILPNGPWESWETPVDGGVFT